MHAKISELEEDKERIKKQLGVVHELNKEKITENNFLIKDLKELKSEMARQKVEKESSEKSIE